MAKLYDDVLAQSKIRDVLDYYGIPINNGKCLCPFHEDTNPSMVVNEKKNIVKCFSCGEGANPITFIFKYETKVNKNAITYNQAVKKAVEICHLDIDVSMIDKISENHQYTVNGKKYQEDERQMLANVKYANDFFEYQLATPEGKVAKEYLEQRGISLELAKQMGFGYAGKDALSRIIAKNPKLNAYQYEQAGLIRADTNGTYKDVFENRLMIPIKDEKGNTIAFSGRALDDQTPKYLHNCETTVFKKMNNLYNYQIAKNYSYAEELYVVEGFMDVVGAKRMGIDNAVALMGVELGDPQMDLIKKCKCDIVLALDNDQAGMNAMLKHIPKLLKAGLSTYVIDIAKLGDFKDFGDVANVLPNKAAVDVAKVTAFTYLMDHQYFKANDFSVQNIVSNYKSLRSDEILITTQDLAMLKEYIQIKTTFQKEELEEILHPKNLVEKEQTTLDLFKQNLMNQSLITNLETFIKGRDDKVVTAFYYENKETLDQHILKNFTEDTEHMLNKQGEVNYALLLANALSNNKEYEKYEFLHRFQYEEVFEHCYIKNQDAQARLALDFNQKKTVIHQYDNTLSDTEKLNLENVTDLYVINTIDDIDAILPNIVDPTLKETIKERLAIQPGMQFFKFSTVFNSDMIPYLSPEYLNEDKTAFKTILFFNNLNGSMQLSKANVIQEEAKTITKVESKEIDQDIKEDKDMEVSEKISEPFTLSMLDLKANNQTNKNRILLSSEQIISDTTKGIYFRTTDKDIMLFAPKNLCSWKDDSHTHIVVIPQQRLFSNQTMLSKYMIGSKEFLSKTTLDELQTLVKVLDPQQTNVQTITFQKGDVHISQNGFAQIGAFYQNQVGYFKINASNLEHIDGHYELHAKPYYEYSFYNKDNDFISKVNVQELAQHIQVYKDKGLTQTFHNFDSPLAPEPMLDIEHEQIQPKRKFIPSRQVEISQDVDFAFTIHKSLFIVEKETATDYFVRIPNTQARSYMYIPKDGSQWSMSGEMLYANLEADKTYSIYNKTATQSKDWTFASLKSRWEDKTNSQNGYGKVNDDSKELEMEAM